MRPVLVLAVWCLLIVAGIWWAVRVSRYGIRAFHSVGAKRWVLLLVCALVAAVSVLMLGLVFLWLWVVLRAWLLVERMHH